jgi:hypothetical protein
MLLGSILYPFWEYFLFCHKCLDYACVVIYEMKNKPRRRVTRVMLFFFALFSLHSSYLDGGRYWSVRVPLACRCLMSSMYYHAVVSTSWMSNRVMASLHCHLGSTFFDFLLSSGSSNTWKWIRFHKNMHGHLCGLVVRVPCYRSRGPGWIPGATRFSESSGSGTGSTQAREYNWGATWKKC